jgi:hypothetical protein
MGTDTGPEAEPAEGNPEEGKPADGEDGGPAAEGKPPTEGAVTGGSCEDVTRLVGAGMNVC